MEIISDLTQAINMPECAATIGVFDGVHVGHQFVIRQMMDDAQQLGYKSMVITFDRLPQQLFVPDFQPQLLTTLDEKCRLIETLGVDYLVVLPFTHEMASLTAREFMAQVLQQRLGVKVLRTGYDNRFGRGRSEGFADYVCFGRELGIDVRQATEKDIEGFSDAVSSSLIRRLLVDDGRVADARRLLTRAYQLKGRVVNGEHIGTGLGYPTANIELENSDKLLPQAGVYAVWASVEDGQRMPAMMNIGCRPTFNGQRQTLEVNILDFSGNLYGRTLTIGFVERVRSEQRFASSEELIAQLESDKAFVRNIFANL